MPTNVNPQYSFAEKEYYAARTTEEQIKALQKMISYCPSHKGCEHLRAENKRRLAKLKESQKREEAKKGSQKITLKRDGAAQAVIFGLPNSGKSTLLNKLTNAKVDIAPYEFTTVKPEHGIMEYEGIKIQIVEMPAITEGYYDKSNGALFFSLARGSDLIIILLDIRGNIDKQRKIILNEFDRACIRLNKSLPHIKLEREPGGGITILGKENINRGEKEIIEQLNLNGIFNATVHFREKSTFGELKDLLNQSVVYMRAIFVTNDTPLEEIKKLIWNNLNLIKVYTKQPGKEKEWPPVALEKGALVRDLAEHVHKDFVKKFRFARIFGKSVKHQGSQVGIDHILHDNDIVEIHLK